MQIMVNINARHALRVLDTFDVNIVQLTIYPVGIVLDFTGNVIPKAYVGKLTNLSFVPPSPGKLNIDLITC